MHLFIVCLFVCLRPVAQNWFSVSKCLFFSFFSLSLEGGLFFLAVFRAMANLLQSTFCSFCSFILFTVKGF